MSKANFPVESLSSFAIPVENLINYLPASNYGKLGSILALAVAIYFLGSILHHLCLSPIAGFPGPKIAAATGWYEFYYEYFVNGTYYLEIEKMHQIYGPIVRINPYELSIHDPAFYNEIYCTESKRRTEAYDQFSQGIDMDGSHFMTISHDLHRRRRKPLEPYFSRMGVTRLEPTLAELLGKLTRRLENLKGTGVVIRMEHVFASFSADVIGRLCFEDKKDFLDNPDFAMQLSELLYTIIKSTPLFGAFPWIIQIVYRIPESVIAWADSRSQKFLDFKKLTSKHIADVKYDKVHGKITSIEQDGRPSLFRFLMRSEMPESELSEERLCQEAQALLGAGTVSTARTMDFIAYYIIANGHIRARLSEELKNPMADYPKKLPSFVELEKLTYLTAVIKEGLRLGYGVLHRLPRCSPDAPIQYKQYTIPPKVPVGMSAYFMHRDPSVYHNPTEFVPERWLGDVNPLINRNFVPFSRGSRGCLGMNLAYAELYLVMAVLFRPGGPKLELFETDESDVTPIHDFLIPTIKLDSKGLRVVVR